MACAASFCGTWRPLAGRADEADGTEVAAAQDARAESEVLRGSWVMISTMGARGSSPARSRATPHRWTCTAAHRVEQDRQPGVGELSGAGVDEMELDVVRARMRAAQAPHDDAEDGHRRHHGKRLEQHCDGSPATLHAVSYGALSDRASSKVSGTGSSCPAVPGPGRWRRPSTLPPPMKAPSL